MMADKFYHSALQCMNLHSAYIPRPPNTTLSQDDLEPFATAHAARAPCACAHYARTSQHHRFQYGIANDSSFAFLSELEQYLMTTFSLPLSDIPNYWVINVYNDTTSTDWHTDEDELFGALEAETEILSFSLGADGLFAIKPRTGQQLAQALGLGGRHVEQRIKQLGLRHAVKVSHGELLLIGRPGARRRGTHAVWAGIEP